MRLEWHTRRRGEKKRARAGGGKESGTKLTFHDENNWVQRLGVRSCSGKNIQAMTSRLDDLNRKQEVA